MHIKYISGWSRRLYFSFDVMKLFKLSGETMYNIEFMTPFLFISMQWLFSNALIKLDDSRYQQQQQQQQQR